MIIYIFVSFASAERNLFACLPDRPTNSSCKDNYPVYISCNGKVYIKNRYEIKYSVARLSQIQ